MPADEDVSLADIDLYQTTEIANSSDKDWVPSDAECVRSLDPVFDPPYQGSSEEEVQHGPDAERHQADGIVSIQRWRGGARRIRRRGRTGAQHGRAGWGCNMWPVRTLPWSTG